MLIKEVPLQLVTVLSYSVLWRGSVSLKGTLANGFCFKIYDTFYWIYNKSVKEWKLCAFPSPAHVGRQFIEIPIGGAKFKLRCLNTATDRETVPVEKGCVSLEVPIYYGINVCFLQEVTQCCGFHIGPLMVRYSHLPFLSFLSPFVTQGCYSGWFLTFNGFSFTSPLVNVPRPS